MVNINNQATRPFTLHKGVIRGFPLDPQLFIIVAEALNVSIKTVVKNGLVKGIFIM